MSATHKQIESLADLSPDANNVNRGTEIGAKTIEDSLRTFGAGRSIVADRNGVVIAGNKTLENASKAGIEKIRVVPTIGDELVVVQRLDLDLQRDSLARGLALSDNRASEVSYSPDDALLTQMLTQLAEQDAAIASATGYDEQAVAALLESVAAAEKIAANGGSESSEPRKSLAERFIIPPFSVLDARQGYWQERKRAWLALGIESEIGRGGGREVDNERDGSAVETERRSSVEAFPKHGVSPGGSPRPACDYSRRERGDGYGRPIRRADMGQIGSDGAPDTESLS